MAGRRDRILLYGVISSQTVQRDDLRTGWNVRSFNLRRATPARRTVGNGAVRPTCRDPLRGHHLMRKILSEVSSPTVIETEGHMQVTFVKKRDSGTNVRVCVDAQLVVDSRLSAGDRVSSLSD